MADIKVQRAHHLGLRGARTAADKMVTKLDRQFGLTSHWEGDTLHFDRPGVAGAMMISESEMRLEVTLGFLLKAMRGPIERAVHEQIDNLLVESPPESRTRSAVKVPQKKELGDRKKSAK